MASRHLTVAEICRAAKRAARELAQTDTAVKDAALRGDRGGARRARRRRSSTANERDMQRGREADIGDALLDRLRSTSGAIARDRRRRAPDRRAAATRSAR